MEEDSWPAALRWWLSVFTRGDGTSLGFRLFDLFTRSLLWWIGMHVRGWFPWWVRRSIYYAVFAAENARAGRSRGVTTRDFTCGDGVPCRDFEPSARSTNAVLVYMHGGGWCMGSHQGKFHQTAISQLVRRLGCRAVSVGYRLAPEHPFPAAIHDVCSVIRELGADGSPLILAGDSAGGNLALVAALGAKLTKPGDPLHISMPAHLLLIYPDIFDNETADGEAERMIYLMPRGAREFWRGSYLGDDPSSKLRDWRVAPLRAPSLEGLPPTTVVTASLDILYKSNLRLIDALRAAGVAVEHIHEERAPHGFLTLLGVGYGRAAERVLDDAADAAANFIGDLH
jgi:acetyl esterase